MTGNCMGDQKSQVHSLEGSLSLIPRSWQNVRENANKDLQLVLQRACSLKEPLTDLAHSFDEEWEKAWFQRWQDITKSSISSPFKVKPLKEDKSGLLKKWESNLMELHHSYSKPEFPSYEDKVSLRGLKPLNGRLCILAAKDQDTLRKNESLIPIEWSKIWQTQEEGKIAIEDSEPLTHLNASLNDIESSAASSNSPAEFFEKLKKTKLYRNSKRPLERSSYMQTLDAIELLENAIKESTQIMDKIGIKKGFSDRICSIFQRYRHQDKQLSESNTDSLNVASIAEATVHELDLRISSVLQSTGYQREGNFWEEKSMTEEAADKKRHIAIFTTASLPWMTGTAVNPLFRAAYLAKDGKRKVTLVVPWLCKADQELVYPNHITFESPEEQEYYVHQWLESRVGFKLDFKISFYPGKYAKDKRSILAAGDISEFIPDNEADIAVLEEPEHLTWFHHGKRWTKKFENVIGIVHTNYLEYVKREKNGQLKAFLLKHVNNWVTRIYCNKVIRLSGATQELPNSIVCNVHGVNPKFLEIGQRKAIEKQHGIKVFPKGAYYIGKMVWSKGYRELLDLLAIHKKKLEGLQVDVFGNGEDSKEVQEEAHKLGLAINFNPGIDHADESLHGYKVFINPSTTDVVCTTTAEALAMGKIVVCADHPSNEFFKSFPNCLTYKDSQEFVEKVKQALSSEPLPLTSDQQHVLSWEAATDRFISCSKLDVSQDRNGESLPLVSSRRKRTMPLSMSMAKVKRCVDDGFAFTHYIVSGIEPARIASGAIPGTIHPDEEQCKDLGIALPNVPRPLYRC
ncbi:digalactosyldiacylglycerol synthase 2, chloroplastic isoform X1 [Cryptomeria japonica]|uniref:digalactosyldiacylglycerol synthase 2, chloroplastic isoform X1 n=3 Tax=Cryptomeria japonica TaxID=3369 RepID=UPI0025AC3A0F|nr:digalactosyldiacylglycerol synthase 2, chloroplastic isoform X1 [Cryptomeria japonica]XP_057855176.1 digalactosyldiacylglycerol synthase 2, chloroplastic isoform X1 [Cryptomeria japonica]